MRAEDIKNEQKRLMRPNIVSIITLFFTFLSCSVLKPNTYLLKSNHKKALTYSTQIKAEELKKHLNILASDEFEGRETTEPGQKKAANYIKNHFINSNIIFPKDLNSYYQEFMVEVSTFSNVKASRYKILFL